MFHSKNNFFPPLPICLSFSGNDRCQLTVNYITERVHNRHSHMLCWFCLQSFSSFWNKRSFLSLRQLSFCSLDSEWAFIIIRGRGRCFQQNHPFSFSFGSSNCCSCNQPCWKLKSPPSPVKEKESNSVTMYSRIVSPRNRDTDGTKWLEIFSPINWINTTTLRNIYDTMGNRKLHLWLVGLPANESMICL